MPLIVPSVSRAALIQPEADSFSVTEQLDKPAYQDFSYISSGSADGFTLLLESSVYGFVWWRSSSADDRVRSSFRIGVGDIFSGFEAAEVAANETFFDREISPGEELDYTDVFLTPQAKVRQRLLSTNDDLRAYTYETVLSRMNRVFPVSVAVRAVEVDPVQSALTAGAWINYLFGLWAAEYDWFDFVPVQEPLLRDGSSLTAEAFALIQDSENPKSMRAIINEILTVFTGHRLVPRADGRLSIVAPTWSNVYTAAPIPLGLEDFYTLPNVFPEDFSSIVNKVNVKSQGYTYITDQALIAPAYVYAAIRGDISQHFPDPMNFDFRDRTGVFKVVPPVVGGNSVTFDLTLEYYYGSDLAETQVRTVTVARGQEKREYFNTEFGGVCPVQMRVTYALAWDDVTNEIVVFVANNANGLPASFEVTNFPCGAASFLGFGLFVDVLGQAWERNAESVTGSFGAEGDENLLVGLAESRSSVGTVEETISSDFFQLTPEQALSVAKSSVQAKMNPVRRFNAELSVWNRFGDISADDVQQLVQLPSGDEAVLSDLIYADDFETDTPAVSMQAEFTLTE